MSQRKNEDLVVLVFDRSGSMSTGWHHHVNGLVEFFGALKHSKDKSGKPVKVSVVAFDDEYDVVCRDTDIDHLNIRDLLEISCITPRGMTALCDAMGRSIKETGLELTAKEEWARPDKVFFVVQTDGGENSSKMYSVNTVREMVDHQRDKYGWEFIFLGADINAFGVFKDMGADPMKTIAYKKARWATNSTYRAAGQSIGSSRITGHAVQFTDKDREEAQKDDGDA